jgi:hypothetical protein
MLSEVFCAIAYCRHRYQYDKGRSAFVNCIPVAGVTYAAQLGNCPTPIPSGAAQLGDSGVMDTHINIKALQYTDLLELGKLAAEALELSREYDKSRVHKFCNLIAACNVEVIERRRQAERQCGTPVN